MACRSSRAILALLVMANGGCTQYQLYWGDVHTHSNLSDGQGTVEELLTYGRDEAGLDFLIVTDHDFGSGPPWRLAPAAWLHMQEAVEQYTVDGRFVAIGGYEWTSQPKYWTGFNGPERSEGLFEGKPRHFNHKCVYFGRSPATVFGSMDADFKTPDRLAAAVHDAGGIIHNCHPRDGQDARDQWDYGIASQQTIVNTEIAPDRFSRDDVLHEPRTEQVVREFLGQGGITGFVAGSDTHRARPEARTGVWATGLSRDEILSALRNRCNYASTGSRIIVDFRINGHRMGERIHTHGKPRIRVRVKGTRPIAEIVIVRDGVEIRRSFPGSMTARIKYVDGSFAERSYYYVRVKEEAPDRNSNPSYAWSSPIWVTAR